MRILIVDDEKQMAELLRRGLAEEGPAVAVAHTGPEGIAEQRGGRIGVESRPGQGARVEVRLPADSGA